MSAKELSCLKGEVTCDNPNDMLYRFEGVYRAEISNEEI
jgi:hypothetical protein